MLQIIEMIPSIALIVGFTTWASHLMEPLEEMESIWDAEYMLHQCGSLIAGSANLYAAAVDLHEQGADTSKLQGMSELWEKEFQQDDGCIAIRDRLEIFEQADLRSQNHAPNASYRRIAL